MPISKPHSTLGATNKGSCSALALYLDKENLELESLIGNSKDLSNIITLNAMKQDFFNHSRTDISVIEVIDSIDSNIKKLGKNDAKYFGPTISFSQSELQHITYLASGKDNIDNVFQLSPKELNKYNSILKEYIKVVMDNYATNFNRKEKGLESGEDLIYFAKIEHFRKFKGTDEEVRSKLARNGDYKPGLNSHAHIIVSRKDKTQRLKLTPITKERSTQRTIGGNAYQVGFDRIKWIKKNEKDFDTYFQYQRKALEKFKNQYILKNGAPKEKAILLNKIKIEEQSIKNTRNSEQNYTNSHSKGLIW